MDRAEFERYLALLSQLGEQLEKLTALQQEMAQAVRRDDLEAVNQCMKREQALGLGLRSAEQKRDKLLRSLGLEGTRLSELPGRCPPELRERTRETVEALQDRYQIYRSAANVARTTLECNLHQVEKFLAAEGEGPGEPGGLADIRA